MSAIKAHVKNGRMVVDEPTSLEWPAASEAAFPEEAAEPTEESVEPQSDEALWSRSRDFDWGD